MGRNYKIMNCIIVKVVKENEIGWTFGTYCGLGKFIQDLMGGKTCRKEITWKT